MHSITNFKGHPVIQLQRDANDKYPFSLGVAKCKVILDHIKEIKEFVAENDKGR